jgi:hypothetical protein
VAKSFWERPVPPRVRRALLGTLVAVILALVGVAGVWVSFHQTYQNWLNNPPERLVGYPHKLIMNGQVVSRPADDEPDRAIDQFLLNYRTDHAHIAELSRSDVLHFRLLGRAYAKVFLQTHLDEQDPGQRLEFICGFVWRDGAWQWSEIRNLALP